MLWGFLYLKSRSYFLNVFNRKVPTIKKAGYYISDSLRQFRILKVFQIIITIASLHCSVMQIGKV